MLQPEPRLRAVSPGSPTSRARLLSGGARERVLQSHTHPLLRGTLFPKPSTKRKPTSPYCWYILLFNSYGPSLDESSRVFEDGKGKTAHKQEERERPRVTAAAAVRAGTSISYSPNRKAEPREFTPRGSNHTQSGKERAWPRSPNCGRGAADGRADHRTQDGPSGAGRKPQPALTHRPQRPAGPCGTLPPLRWEGKQ